MWSIHVQNVFQKEKKSEWLDQIIFDIQVRVGSGK